MSWYEDIQSILAEESELWLAYLYGQKLKVITHLTRRKKPRFRGLILQIIKFFFEQIEHVSLRQSLPTECCVKYLVYVGSVNQKSSVETMIDGLQQRGESIVSIAHKGLIKNNSDKEKYTVINFTLVDCCKATFLLLQRGLSLHQDLMKIHPLAVNWYFSNFCSVYMYLCYFQRIIGKLKPAFVIVSNDHNPANRCLLAVAHFLGIKTVYLQHASISSLFPALRVNYAFLDGQFALDTYRGCECNQPLNNRNVPIPKVYLTGQKKHLTRLKSSERNAIGLALNALDDTHEAVNLVKHLAEAMQRVVVVRLHPGLPIRTIRYYTAALEKHHQVRISSPTIEPVSAFMESISLLVSGNSSIHLEAALAGVVPVYYELTQSEIPDYYGYVKHGLAVQVKSAEEILRLASRVGDFVPNIEAVRYYSATYLTEWEGYEGDLVAECLCRISRHETCPIPSAIFESLAARRVNFPSL